MDNALDTGYGEKALARIRKAVEGNGFDPDSIVIGSVEGQVYPFAAHIYFRFAPKISEETLPPGKPPGATFQTLATRADLDREVAVYTHKIVEDPTSGAQTAAALLARPDRGFGFTQETLPAAFPSKNYLLKETCPDCKGAAKSACAKCRGTSKVACPKCKTVKLAVCPLCYGRKTSADKKTKCVKCLGQGRIPCMACRQTGYVSCTACGGTGKNACKTCAGSGWAGRKISVDMSVIADYDYDRAALPPDLADMLEKLGPKALVQGIAHLEPGPVGRSEDRVSFVVPCQLTMPFARVAVLMPDQNFTCTVYGHNGRVSGLPPFLDKLIEPGVRELRKAASSGNVALPHIRKACQYRSVRTAVLAAARHSPGQAIEALRREHGSTLSAAMAKNLVALANRALNRIATVPTLVGLAFGLAAATGLYALAFSAIGRTLIGSITAAPAAMAALDGLVFAAGGLLAAFGAAAGNQHAFRSLLGTPQENRRGLSVKKRGWVLWMPWVMSLMVFAAIAFGTLHGNADAPLWFKTLDTLLF